MKNKSVIYSMEYEYAYSRQYELSFIETDNRYAVFNQHKECILICNGFKDVLHMIGELFDGVYGDKNTWFHEAQINGSGKVYGDDGMKIGDYIVGYQEDYQFEIDNNGILKDGKIAKKLIRGKIISFDQWNMMNSYDVIVNENNEGESIASIHAYLGTVNKIN